LGSKLGVNVGSVFRWVNLGERGEDAQKEKRERIGEEERTGKGQR